MKIVMLTQTYPRYPGDTAGTFIQSIAQALVAAGDTVHVILPWDADLDKIATSDGLTVESFRYAKRDEDHLLGYSRTMEADVNLKRQAYRLAPGYALAARRALKRHLKSARPDVVNAHWLVPNGVAAATATKGPLVMSLHGTDVYMAERQWLRLPVRFALGRTGALTGSSQDLVNRTLKIRETANARFIPYGVDPDRFDGQSPEAAKLRERLEVADGQLMILAVGRMVLKKGFDVLLNALSNVRSERWTAVLAGEGDCLEDLKAQAAQLGIGDRVRFPGGVQHDELNAYYTAADIFTMPSVTDPVGNVDGLPNVVMEAMASATAIVGSRIGGIPEVVLDGETGLLAPEKDAAALTAAFERLLESAQERKTLGANARAKVLAELTWTHVAARYRQAYVDAGAPA